MLTSLTVGRIIDLANGLAKYIAPTRKKLCPAIKELAILNNDRKIAMETLAYLKRRGEGQRQC